MNAESEMNQADGLGADEDARDAQIAAGTDPMGRAGFREEVVEGGIPEGIVSRLDDDAVLALWHAQGDLAEDERRLATEAEVIDEAEGQGRR